MCNVILCETRGKIYHDGDGGNTHTAVAREDNLGYGGHANYICTQDRERPSRFGYRMSVEEREGGKKRELREKSNKQHRIHA